MKLFLALTLSVIAGAAQAQVQLDPFAQATSGVRLPGVQ